MKNKSLLTVALLAFLATPELAGAVQNPEIFGVQKNAASVEISPDGKLLMVKDDKEDYRIWDVPARRPLWNLATGYTFFSPDSRFIAVVEGIGVQKPKLSTHFKLLDARTGRLVRLLRYKTGVVSKGATQAVDEMFDCAFSVDGHEFRAATRLGLGRWSVAHGQLIKFCTWKGSDSRAPVIEEGSFSPDGKLFLARRDVDESDLLFDARSAQLVHSRKNAISGAYGFSTASNLLWITEPEGEWINVFRVSDNKLLWKTCAEPTFSPDGKLAYIHVEHGLDVLDAQTGRKLRHLAGPDEFDFAPSPDGKWLYEAHGGKIYRWATS